MNAKHDVPDWISQAFRLDGNDVRWLSADDYLAGGLTRRSLPFGQIAGGRIVHGRGRLVRAAGRYLLNSNVASMLADHGRWPWERPDWPGCDTGLPGPDDDARAVIVRRTLRMTPGGGLRWLRAPAPGISIGDVATGLVLAGRLDRCVTIRGVGYVSGDVVHLLRAGEWPWASLWD